MNFSDEELIAAKKRVTISGALLIDEARKRGWKLTLLGDDPRNVIIFTVPLPDGKSVDLLFRGQRSLGPSVFGQQVCQNKHLTSIIAKQFGYRHPITRFCTSIDQAKEFLKEHKRIVVKPLDAAHGEGITVNVRTDVDVETAYAFAFKANISKHWKGILTQVQHIGDDYRLLLVDYKVCAVAKRVPAYVIGDGKRNISQLIELRNQDPRRGESHESPLTKINFEEARKYLGGADKLLRIPGESEHVAVCGKGNLSLGGESHDYTDKISPTIAEECVAFAQRIGIGVCGMDVLARDISAADGWTILEINASPGFRMHVFPASGASRNVAAAVIDYVLAQRLKR